MKKKYFYKWHGEDVKVKFGFCIAKQNKEKHLYWYNYECLSNNGELNFIPSIQITSKDGKVWTIANHFGIGVYKLEMGGWPNCTHFSLENEWFSNNWNMTIRKFDLDGYSEYESNRDKWRKENYTKEYNELEAFRKSIIKTRN